jgi:hypothetical protein
MASPISIARTLSYRVNHLAQFFRNPETRRRFSDAARRYNTSRKQLMLRALALYRVGRFTPDEALSRGLLDPSLPLDSHEAHFSEERLHAMQIAINSPNVAVCRDKLLFHAYCQRYRLPMGRLFGVISSQGSRDEQGNMLGSDEQWRRFVETTLPPSFIVKPRGGNKGRSIELTGIAHQTGKDRVASLVKGLRALPNSGDDWLMEERIGTHERIVALTGTEAVSTVRMVTLIEGDSDPQIMGSHFRVIAGDSLTDNINDWQTGKLSGNILALPDLDTGVVTEAWVPNPDGIGYQRAGTHPRTGLPIEGFEIPCWESIRQLVKAAAISFLPIRTVGWDVAVTPAGPVLIEANEQYQYSSFGPRVLRLRAALRREQARLAGVRRSTAIRASS